MHFTKNGPKRLRLGTIVLFGILSAGFLPLSAQAQSNSTALTQPEQAEVNIDLQHTTDVSPGISTELQSNHSAIRLSALRKLDDAGAGAAPYVPDLIKVVSGIHDDERQQALSILRAIGPEAAPAVPVLIETLDDKQFLRDRAIEALEAIGPPAKAAVPGLIKVLREGNTTSHAELALASIGADAVPALFEGLKDKSADCRRMSVCALGKVKLPADLPMDDKAEVSNKAILAAISRMLKDNVLDVAREACWALEKIGAPAKDSVPDLIEAMNSKNGYLRQFSADALGSIGPSAKDALPVLNKALTDEQVRVNARSAIKKIEQGGTDID